MPDADAVTFDHYDPSLAADPFPVYGALRERCPVAHTEAHDGYWVVSRYDGIRDVLHRPEDFSSRYPSIPRNVGLGDVFMPPLQLDPPEHTRMKRLLTPAFSPGRAAGFEPAIRRFVVDLLDDLGQQGRFDASRDFARLIPGFAVCQLIGLPGELDRFTGWVERLLEQIIDNYDDAAAAGMEMMLYLSDLVAKRSVDRGDDVVSLLLGTEIDGDRLDPGEVTCAVLLLFLAGIDTTWRVLATTIHHLAANPDQQAELRACPTLPEMAREEFLRAFAPVSLARVAVGDREIGGRCVRAGEQVYLPLVSANRDERVFPRADEVILDRQPNPHLAFGGGIHRCLGLHLARMELTVALEELLHRLPPFRLADPAAVVWANGPVRGPKNVEIVFER